MTITKDRAAATSPVPTPTVTNRAATEDQQCRMQRSDGSRCPNAALPHADGEAVVCAKHASRVLALIKQQREITRCARRPA